MQYNVSIVFYYLEDDEKIDETIADPPKQSDEFCLTPECVIAAGDIIRSMDTSVPPCENFYEFSCGGWVKDNPIPDTASSWGRFNILRNKLNQDVRSKNFEIKPAYISKVYSYFTLKRDCNCSLFLTQEFWKNQSMLVIHSQ